ncbi:FG-GAP repeat domain-containing protein [Hyunsoonleella pacifica]|uniref:VCBS repeat-containing protein n=1 Tax=Hyunsoonleella pacifica TaxID=1080224 RepID=A0A4V2JBC8_9FLAO|nr:VCBS repeat-containing protein [Hyunsoonleella pacifica]TBN18731.1 VCBS repeat-containing protein [Hyunsoonleella pacifica]GGD04236.1 hypothetical protein GCM10011368_02600 [Hyunsoonleella pacifica]
MIKILLSVFVFLVFILDKANGQDKVWNRHVVDSSYNGADGVRLADVNNDGLMDITTGWEESGYTKVYLHPGFKLVQEKWPSVIVGKTPYVEDAVFADLDDDGAVDVISSTEWKHKKIYVNWAPVKSKDYLDKTKWKTQSIPTSDGLMQWMYAYPAQIDGKNGLDIIAGGKHENAQIGWFEIPKDARCLNKWKWHSISAVSWLMSIMMSDMDNDGDLDILISDRKGALSGVRWLENPETIRKQKKEWKNHNIENQGLEVMFLDLADLDGDGLEDVIVTEANKRKIWFIKRLDKSDLSWKSYPIDIPKYTSKPKSVVAGDVNGDGKSDLVHSFEKAEGNLEGIYWLSYKNLPTDVKWE